MSLCVESKNGDLVDHSLRLEYRILDILPDALSIFESEFLPSSNHFLLESSVVRAGFSRFSFMGDSAATLGETITWRTANGVATISGVAGEKQESAASIFELLQTRLQQKHVQCPPVLPFCFNLGYVGFLGYELKGETSGSRAWSSDSHDSAFIFASRMIALDHQEGRCYLLHLVNDDSSQVQANEWFSAVDTRLHALVKNQTKPKLMVERREKLTLQDVEEWITANAVIRHDKDTYIRKIHEALQEITDGESYEVCLTNIIEFGFEHSPFDLYRIMRELTPAPHAAYFSIDDFHLVSSSPERFLSVSRDRFVEAKPIKGTRPRGHTADEDTRQAESLRANEKDRAENLMIVDLLRNDLGQVCALQSVHVPRLFEIETYSHVHQLVSTIRGQLKPDSSTVECVRAAFPGGSMTGAPKKRTMEIIDRLEEGPRGVYSGAFGWFGLCGACDLSIIIRSIAINGGNARFGVGGAITSLSDPEEEFIETMVKARGVVEAVRLLQGMHL